MDYELLKTFITLAKLKNFTKTADALHIVQSTVTNRIKHIEENIGETLFIRTNKNVVLTNAGEAYLPYAKQLLAIHEAAISKIKSLELFKDTLTIGVVHSIYDCHVQEMILKYMKKYKTTAVNVIIEHSENLIQMLHDNEVDIAFTYLNVKSSKFTCTPFFTDEVTLVTGPQYSHIQNPITYDELKKLPILCAAISFQSFQEWFYSIFPANYIYPLDINISASVIPFLQERLGCGFMLKPAVQKYINEGTLLEVKLLDNPPPSANSYMLINTQKLNSESINNWLELNGDL